MAKIRSACDLALFDRTGDARRQTSAVQHLAAALSHWKNCSLAYPRQYVHPVLDNRGKVAFQMQNDKGLLT